MVWNTAAEALFGFTAAFSLKDTSGEVLGAMACARDITEKHLKDKDLKKRAQLTAEQQQT